MKGGRRSSARAFRALALHELRALTRPMQLLCGATIVGFALVFREIAARDAGDVLLAATCLAGAVCYAAAMGGSTATVNTVADERSKGSHLMLARCGVSPLCTLAAKAAASVVLLCAAGAVVAVAFGLGPALCAASVGLTVAGGLPVVLMGTATAALARDWSQATIGSAVIAVTALAPIAGMFFTGQAWVFHVLSPCGLSVWTLQTLCYGVGCRVGVPVLVAGYCVWLAASACVAWFAARRFAREVERDAWE